ncbi:Fanconi-associated nuclease 1-like protein [Drosera capensis]
MCHFMKVNLLMESPKQFLKHTLLVVGFCGESEIKVGDAVSFLRYSDNDKDKNAIKVVDATDRCRKLGFLPKDLAQYLSPLMSKSASFRENALNCVNSGKKFPPSIAKYQYNFLFIMEEVLRSNQHLFTDDEKKFLESFNSLSDDDQRLFFRLYTRKEAGFLHPFFWDGEADEDYLDGVLNLLTVLELLEISSKIAKRLVLDKLGTCVRITPYAEFIAWRLQRLLFLNGTQDLSAFLLSDMGIVKYPLYKCIVSDEVFSDRNHLLAYEEAIEVAQIMDESLDENQSVVPEAEIVPAFLQCFSASWVYSKVVLLGVSFLESEHRYNDAIKLLNNFTCD